MGTTQEEMTMTKPAAQAEHEWLQKLVGEWTSEMEGAAPGEPTQKMTGTESVRALGDLWTLGEGRGMAGPDAEDVSVMTLGYDPAKNCFVGTFVSSAMTHMWQYEGELQGDTLTLRTEGPSMAGDGAMVPFRDVIEFKDDNHRVLSSFMQQPDGTWEQFMEAHYHRR